MFYKIFIPLLIGFLFFLLLFSYMFYKKEKYLDKSRASSIRKNRRKSFRLKRDSRDSRSL